MSARAVAVTRPASTKIARLAFLRILSGQRQVARFSAVASLGGRFGVCRYRLLHQELSPGPAVTPLRRSSLRAWLGKLRKDCLKLGGDGSPAILATESAPGIGMDFVCPPVLVIGLSVRQGVAEIDVGYVPKVRLPHQILEHRVEPIDDGGHHLSRDVDIAEELLVKARLEPRARKQPTAAEKTATVRDGIIVAVHKDGEGAAETLLAKGIDGEEHQPIRRGDAGVDYAGEDLIVPAGDGLQIDIVD